MIASVLDIPSNAMDGIATSAGNGQDGRGQEEKDETCM